MKYLVSAAIALATLAIVLGSYGAFRPQPAPKTTTTDSDIELAAQARKTLTTSAYEYGYNLESPPKVNTVTHFPNGDVWIYFTVRFENGVSGDVKVILKRADYRVDDIVPAKTPVGTPRS